MTIDVYDKEENKFYGFSTYGEAKKFMNEKPDSRSLMHHLVGLRIFQELIGVNA